MIEVPRRRLFGHCLTFTLLMITGGQAAAVLSDPSTPARIAAGAPVIQHFGPEDYGSLPQIWSITQDHRGIMYIGADAGVMEFDGRRWQLITTPKAGLVRSLATAADGTVYVGSVAEFGYLAPGPNGETVYRSLSAQLNESNYHQFDNVWSTHTTSHGAYFVGDNVIYRWYNGELTAIDSPKRNWGFTVEDTVVIYHREGGLAQIVDGQMSLLPGTEALSSNTAGRIFIAPYSPDELIVFTTKSGTYRYRFKASEPNQSLTPDPTSADAEIERLNLYYQGAYDTKGRYFLPTLGEEILVVDRQGQILQTIGEAQGFNGGGVTQLFQDDGGNLWVGSLNGIYHIQLDSPWTLHDTAAINPSSIIRTRLHQGHLYISSYNGIYYRPNPEEANALNPSFQRVDVPQLQTFDLDSVGPYLMAGVQGEVFSIRGDQATRLLELDQAPMIMALGHSKLFPQHLFIGTYSQGIRALEFREDQEGLRSWEIPLPETELSKQSIRFIEQDIDGDLWIGSESNGIYRLVFTGELATDYQIIHYNENNGLPDPAGLGLIAQDGKLALFNASDIYRIEKDAGEVRFVAEGIGKMDPDESNTIDAARYFGNDYFVQRQRGLVLYRRQPNGSFIAQTEEFTATPSEQFSNQGTYAVPDQHIWLSMSTTLYQFDPQVKKDYRRDYPALIRTVSVANTLRFAGRHHQNGISHDAMTLTQQPTTDIPIIEYQNNTVGFEFAAAFYEYLDNVEFSYQLQGFDSGWSAWSSDIKKEYTNLPENDYRFRVKARNAHGHESSEAVYAFGILPPWHRTTWAYLLYFTSAALIIALSVRAYSWRLVRARKRLTQLVKTRTAELEASFEELRATQNLLAKASHDAGMARVAKSVLHNVGNALNSVMTASSMLLERMARPVLVDKLRSAIELIPKRSQEYAHFFGRDGKGAKLPEYLIALEQQLRAAHGRVHDDTTSLRDGLQRIEHILDQQRELTKAIEVREEVTLASLLQDIVAQSEICNLRPDIRLRYDIHTSASYLLDRHGIQSVLLVLLNNAKDAIDAGQRDDKTITVSVHREEKGLRIAVHDNGVGIEVDKIDTIFTPQYTSKDDVRNDSLHEAANVAAQMNGRLSCHSDGPGHGACFYLDLAAEPGRAHPEPSEESIQSEAVTLSES